MIPLERYETVTKYENTSRQSRGNSRVLHKLYLECLSHKSDILRDSAKL
jgi:hypothetical protein